MSTLPPACFRLSRRLPGVAADPRHLFPRLAGSRHAVMIAATGLQGEALRTSALLDAATAPELVVQLCGDVAVLETPGQRRFLEGRAPLAALAAVMEPLGEPERLPASDGLPLGPFGPGLVGLVRGLPDGQVDGALFLADRAVRIDRVTGGVESELLATTSSPRDAATATGKEFKRLAAALDAPPGKKALARERAAAMTALLEAIEPFEPGAGGASFVVDGPEGGVVFPAARALVVFDLLRLQVTLPPAQAAEHGLYDGLATMGSGLTRAAAGAATTSAGAAELTGALELVEAILARRAERGLELPCLLALSAAGSLVLLAPETPAPSSAPVGKRRRRAKRA